MSLDAPQRAALGTFIASLADVPWLSRAGDPDETAIVADDLVDAWDGWNKEMLAVFPRATHELERIAVNEVGEDGVDMVFVTVGRELDTALRAAMECYYDTRSKDTLNGDRGLWPEWLDALKRDLSWAAIETVLHRPGLFTEILPYYRAGRWPCAWEDGDRAKRIVVL